MIGDDEGDGKKKRKGARGSKVAPQRRELKMAYSEWMSKLGQTLLRLLLLLLFSPPLPSSTSSSRAAAACLPLFPPEEERKKSTGVEENVAPEMFYTLNSFNSQLPPPLPPSLGLSLSVALAHTLSLNLISKAHHVLSPVSKGTWPPSISVSTHRHTDSRYWITYSSRDGAGNDRT